MKSLYSLYPDHKKVISGEKYLVDVATIVKNATDKLDMFCSECQKHFTARPRKIFIGQQPCGCGNFYYKTPELKLVKLEKLCQEKGFAHITTDQQIKKSHDRVGIRCLECFNEWQPTYSALVNSGRGCPKCAGQYRYTDEEYIERINQAGDVNKFKFLSKTGNDKLRQHSHVALSCNICKVKWEASVGNILSLKYSCPSCASRGFNPGKRSLLYILKISSDLGVIAYKYGITNNFTRRLDNMGIANSHKIEITATWGYENGLDARKHENLIKKKFKSFLSKEELPDGYTETVSPEKLLDLFQFQSRQYLQDI